MDKCFSCSYHENRPIIEDNCYYHHNWGWYRYCAFYEDRISNLGYEGITYEKGCENYEGM